MKKIIAILALSLAAFSTSAFAWQGGYRGGWVAPALIGGVVGYSLARPYYYGPPPVYYAPPPPVVYAPPPVYIQQARPAGYVQQTILDANCNCYRTVLVQQ